MFRRAVRKVKRLLSIAGFCRRITPLYSPKYLRVFLHATALCRRERFLPVEAFQLGLFNPNLRHTDLAKYVSRKRLTKIQKALNPASWASLVTDKSIFYRYCMAIGVSIPSLYAIFFGQAAGCSCNGSILASREDWTRFLAADLPSEFVTKPARGAHGQGVNVFTRKGEEFLDAFGNSYSVNQLYEALHRGAGEDGSVIQERLKNHPELVRLSGTQSLQTVRVITLLDGNGSCRILHANLKAIVGEQVVDTLLDGLTGNVAARIGLDDGLLEPAVLITTTGRGIKRLTVHPETGVSFDGFALPLWLEVRNLVRQVAPKFSPLRTIGWDVALTPNGACIVEGNVWWDPPNQHGRMASLLEALSGDS